VELTEELALAWHAFLLRQVVLMLCAGIIHGDLSEYNILVDADGPVIIDLPQAVDAAGNTEAEAMFARDVDNLATYFSRFAPQLATTQYAKEIWALYGAGLLSPETVLTGQVAADDRPADVDAVMREIALARKEEEERLRRQQEMAGPSAATWARA
jgi:RIO kinase 1